MALNSNDLRTYPVQKKLCKTCPFAGKNPTPLTLDRYLQYLENIFGKGQHLCHSAADRKICRGGRNIQLKWLCAICALDEPTDEAFNQAVDEAMQTAIHKKQEEQSMNISLSQDTLMDFLSERDGLDNVEAHAFHPPPGFINPDDEQIIWSGRDWELIKDFCPVTGEMKGFPSLESSRMLWGAP